MEHIICVTCRRTCGLNLLLGEQGLQTLHMLSVTTMNFLPLLQIANVERRLCFHNHVSVQRFVRGVTPTMTSWDRSHGHGMLGVVCALGGEQSPVTETCYPPLTKYLLPPSEVIRSKKSLPPKRQIELRDIQSMSGRYSHPTWKLHSCLSWNPFFA